MLSTDNWCLKVAEKIYGPYTTDQMQSFAREGRLSGSSLVAPAGARNWRQARNYPNLLKAGNDNTASRNNSSFGKQQEAEQGKLPEGAVSNFLIIFDEVSGAASRLEHIVRNIGPGFRLTSNVWTVASDQSVMGIKNTIAPHLQVREPVFVVDVHRGKSAWQNFVPETHSRLTKAWTLKK